MTKYDIFNLMDAAGLEHTADRIESDAAELEAAFTIAENLIFDNKDLQDAVKFSDEDLQEVRNALKIVTSFSIRLYSRASANARRIQNEKEREVEK